MNNSFHRFLKKYLLIVTIFCFLVFLNIYNYDIIIENISNLIISGNQKEALYLNLCTSIFMFYIF